MRHASGLRIFLDGGPVPTDDREVQVPPEAAHRGKARVREHRNQCRDLDGVILCQMLLVPGIAVFALGVHVASPQFVLPLANRR